ncbi:zona pellucida sperm-binding protein 4-like [Pelodytes ibericus]
MSRDDLSCASESEAKRLRGSSRDEDVQDFWDDPSYLGCGTTNLQFSLPYKMKDPAYVLRALDHKGKTRILRNSSACGVWVGQKPDGCMLVGATYDGCFVREKNGDYVMTIRLDETNNGQVQQHKKDLKCPIMPAMDAPNPNLCAAIPRQDRLSCTSQPVSSEICEGLECCFNPSDSTMPCYYGKPLTTQCTKDTLVQVAISSALTQPPLILDSVRVLNVDSNSCPELKVTKSTSFIAFKFPMSCGSSKQMADVSVIYENTIEASQDLTTWKGASITRDSTIRVTVRCLYARSGIIPLQAQVFTLPPPLPVSTTGPLLLEMRIAKDRQYSSYYVDGDYPVQKVLRDPVYLEVRILQRTDPSLVLILNDCWANPFRDGTQQPQWPIITNRCPFPGDNYLTQQIPLGTSNLNIPFPSQYQRFAISTFTFVDGNSQLALGGLVYFHCSASVCVPSTFDSCLTSCTIGNQRMIKKRDVGEPMKMVTSDGPVNFIGTTSEAIPMEGQVDSYYPAWNLARGAAAAGVFLTGILIITFWMHHRKRSPKVYTVKA